MSPGKVRSVLSLVVALAAVVAVTAIASAGPSDGTGSSPAPAAQTPTPTSSPTSPPVGELERRISLRLRSHLTAKGQISANAPACWRGITVRIKRLEGGEWTAAARTSSNSEGFYRVRVKDREGAYRASVRRNGSCPAARSRTRQHSH